MAKKSKNPMEYKIVYYGHTKTETKYYRNISSAIDLYKKWCKRSKSDKTHINVIFYDNIENKIITQYDNKDPNSRCTTKNIYNGDKPAKKSKKYEVRLQKVGYDKRFYAYRYFYKRDSAEKFYNEMCQIESVSGVILYDRELNKNILEYIKEDEPVTKETVSIPLEKESRIKKFFREIKEILTKRDLFM